MRSSAWTKREATRWPAKSKRGSCTRPKRWEDAAAVYQDAASKAKDSHRAASLWREAACIFEKELGDPHRAIDAWVAASKCDIRYLDVYRRLAALYQSQGRLDALAALTDARIDAGADTPTLVGLLVAEGASES